MNFSRAETREMIAKSGIFDQSYYTNAYEGAVPSDVDLLDYWIETGTGLNHNPNPLFNTEWYIRVHGLEQPLTVNPLAHYLHVGWKNFLDPSALFSVEEYLARNGDVAAAGMDPLTHYVNFGASEGRPFFRSRAEEFYFPILPHSARKVEMIPEPGIKPSAPKVKLRKNNFAESAEIVSAIHDAAKLTGIVSEELFRSIAMEFALLKLSIQADAGEVILPPSNELSRSATSLKSLLGLGIIPLNEIDASHTTVYNNPILDRYSDYRIDISNRLKLDPKTRETVNGDVKISLLMPVYKSPITYLERAILSVFFQTYANWELILVNDYSESEGIDQILRYYSSIDDRIKVIHMPKNGGISAATNAGLAVATGDYIGLIDHDDMLTKDALTEVARKLMRDRSIDWIYTDEAKITDNDIPDEIYTKPDWSPALLLNLMYTGHFSVYRRLLVERAGAFRSQYDFSQDYDLALRMSELTTNIVHIEKCLYGWRMIPGSAAVGDKPTARQTNLGALQSAADRRDYPAIAIGLPTGNRLVQVRAQHSPLVSIIIPSDNFNNILNTLQSVVSNTTYSNFEFIVVTNSKLIAANSRHVVNYGVTFAPYDKPYNFSDKCNVGAKFARGEFLLLLNDDVRVVTPNWIEIMLEAARLPNVGAVAPKLLYESGHIQHAGMVTGVRRIVGTAFHAYPSNTGAHFNTGQSLREVSLLCGACIMLPKAVYEDIGGFDAINVPISHSDVDLCFKVRAMGLTCVYTPFATLTHIGHQSRDSQDFDTSKSKKFVKDPADIFLLRRWAEYCSYDPYFTPSMRDMIYIDSPERYTIHPSKSAKNLDGPAALVVSHDLSQSGAPRVALDLVHALHSQGYFVVVMSPSDGAMREAILESGAHVIIDSLTLQRHASVRDFASNFDLVIANTAVSWPIVHQIGEFTDVYWYIHETGLIEDLADNCRDFRPSFARAAAIWVGSERAQLALRQIGIQSKVIEYGVDSEEFDNQPDTTSPNKLTISIMGSLEKRKGQDIAIEGFLAMPDNLRSNMRLNICGRTLDEAFAQSIELLASGHSNIQLAGELDYRNYISVLMSSDVILCTSRDDTLPLVSLHALAAGKILVVSAETGTSKYVRNGVSGFVLSENAPLAVRDVLAALCRDRRRAAKIGAEARKLFLKHFSRTAFQKSIVEEINATSRALAVR